MPDDCSTCAARLSGVAVVVAAYCGHAGPRNEYPNGRPIATYPEPPEWCPGYIAEDDDYEWSAQC